MLDSTQLIDKSLVVDSSFASRKTLINDLRQSNLCREVIEAQSVCNGLEILSKDSIDACLIGPTLNEDRAIEFIKQGSAQTSVKHCAFIAISSSGERLLEAGAHAILAKPYSPKTFTSIVKSAIEKARSTKSLIHSKHIFEDILTNTAQELKKVSALLKTGKLKLDLNNQPSLASRDAIRLAIEKAFILPTNEAQQIGSFDHHFITCIIEWFSEQASGTNKNPTENLRKRLLDFYKKSLNEFISSR